MTISTPPTPIDTITPWYKHFWLWFIIILPASAVVASIVTVIIAFENEDSLVADDYYKDGLGINQKLAQDKAAEKFSIAATVVVDELIGELRVTLDGSLLQWPETINMNWFHPTIKKRDISIQLRKTVAGEYVGQLDHLLSGRWYVQLAAAEPEPWRIKSEADLNYSYTFDFGYSKSNKPVQYDSGAQ